ncbi:SrfA family protein [Pantoea sp.]|uniref:SrfA family protein n=1 Tax=Pantoea sp. TaxID=69393 RepID=UPI0025EA3706|nr:SrfA family protein [Pantoea sp.]
MRNSIQGPLLRTGNNSSFKALGETGYPVFRMAFQLREAIYRLDAGHDLARHLAIPQNDQGGDRTDWYSSFAGDVIPWSSASESEQASARQQFTEFHMAVQTLSERMLNAGNNDAGGDRHVFAKLLKSVVNFPDDEFLYLVNGVLVITFWGFVHPTEGEHSPMHWLQPGSVPMQTPVAPLSHATPSLAQPLNTTAQTIETLETATFTRRKKWNWRWLLWLLVALLSLALILGLLRGCVPSLSLPGLVHHSQSVSDVDNSPTVEGQTQTDSGLNVPATSGTVVSTTSGTDNTTSVVSPAGAVQENTPPQAVSDPTTADATVPEMQSSTEAQQPVANNEAPAAESATNTEPSATPAPVAEPQNSKPLMPAEPFSEVPPMKPSQGQPLALPVALQDGPAQFLNGQWRVNGGIQDKLTGRPLQLQYDFKQGNGTVSVRQSNGVTCKGPAQGSVKQGALNIMNPEQMKCSDDSNFIGPTIECKSLNAAHTDCVGNNAGDKTFPIRMLQPHS